MPTNPLKPPSKPSLKVSVPPAKVENTTHVSVDTQDLARVVAQLSAQQTAMMEALRQQAQVLAQQAQALSQLAGKDVPAPTVNLPKRAREYHVEVVYDEEMQRVGGMRVMVAD